MMRGDEIAQAAGAASPEDALAESPRRIDTGSGNASPTLCIEQSTRRLRRS